jgi:hypothetical protein
VVPLHCRIVSRRFIDERVQRAGGSSLSSFDEALGLGLIGKDNLCDVFWPSECASQKVSQTSEESVKLLSGYQLGQSAGASQNTYVRTPSFLDPDLLLSLSIFHVWFPAKPALS